MVKQRGFEAVHGLPPCGQDQYQSRQVSVAVSRPDTVIDVVMHEEPGATRDPEVASLQVQLQADEAFAHSAEVRLVQPGRMLRSRVHLINFRSGKGEICRRTLIRGPEFRSLGARLVNRI